MPLKRPFHSILFVLWGIIPLALLLILLSRIYSIHQSSQMLLQELMVERNSHLAEQVFIRLELLFFERIKDISHLASVVADDDSAMAVRRFTDDAVGIMEREVSYESIGFFDSLFRIATGTCDQNSSLRIIPSELLQEALNNSIPVLTSPLEISEDTYTIGILVPVPRTEAFGPGVVAGMLRLEQIINNSIRISSLKTKHVEVIVNGIIIIGRNDEAFDSEGGGQCSVSISREIFGSNWTITVDRPFSTRLQRLSTENRTHYLQSTITTIIAAGLFFLIIVLSVKSKTSERRLMISEERYRRLTENARDIIFRFSISENRFEYVSPAGFSLTGYSSQEFYQNPGVVNKIIAPEWWEYSKYNWHKLTHGVIEPFYELRIISKAGQSRWLQLRAVIICSSRKKRVDAVEGTAADVTELRTAFEERNKLITELENKNAELERFAYTISHELKTPLITIRGFLGYLEKEAREGDMGGLYKDISLIRVATETMRKLLDGLIELSRVGRRPGEPEDVNFTELVHQAASRFEPVIRKRNVDIYIAEEMPLIHGNRAELLELMENLLENSIKFLGDQPKPRISVDFHTEGNETIFAVKDNGIGVESKYQERIFGIFHKLDPGSEGAGVGLALAKRIVNAHGGWISLYSPGPGKGTTIRFTLPVVRRRRSVR